MIGSPSAGKSLVGEIVSIDDLCYREVFFHQLLRQLVRRRDDSGGDNDVPAFDFCYAIAPITGRFDCDGSGLILTHRWP